MTLTGPVFFCKLLLNGASHDTKIGCIGLVWAGPKKYKYYLLGSLRLGSSRFMSVSWKAQTAETTMVPYQNSSL